MTRHCCLEIDQDGKGTPSIYVKFGMSEESIKMQPSLKYWHRNQNDHVLYSLYIRGACRRIITINLAMETKIFKDLFGKCSFWSSSFQLADRTDLAKSTREANEQSMGTSPLGTSAWTDLWWYCQVSLLKGICNSYCDPTRSSCLGAFVILNWTHSISFPNKSLLFREAVMLMILLATLEVTRKGSPGYDWHDPTRKQPRIHLGCDSLLGASSGHILTIWQWLNQIWPSELKPW